MTINNDTIIQASWEAMRTLLEYDVKRQYAVISKNKKMSQSEIDKMIFTQKRSKLQKKFDSMLDIMDCNEISQRYFFALYIKQIKDFASINEILQNTIKDKILK